MKRVMFANCEIITRSLNPIWLNHAQLKGRPELIANPIGSWLPGGQGLQLWRRLAVSILLLLQHKSNLAVKPVDPPSLKGLIHTIKLEWHLAGHLTRNSACLSQQQNNFFLEKVKKVIVKAWIQNLPILLFECFRKRRSRAMELVGSMLIGYWGSPAPPDE